MPPSRAMQMAVAASVTVSIADDTIGMASRMPGRQLRPHVDVLGNDVAFGRNQQDVVEGERFPKMTVRQHLGTLANQGARGPAPPFRVVNRTNR